MSVMSTAARVVVRELARIQQLERIEIELRSISAIIPATHVRHEIMIARARVHLAATFLGAPRLAPFAIIEYRARATLRREDGHVAA